jgi:hypothetical protein
MRSGKGGSRLLARQRPPPTRVGGSHAAVRASGYAARGRRPSNTHVRPAWRSRTSGTCSRGTASNQARGIGRSTLKWPLSPAADAGDVLDEARQQLVIEDQSYARPVAHAVLGACGRRPAQIARFQ